MIVTCLKPKNDVTPSITMTDITFDHFSEAIDVKAAYAFKTVTLLFHITQFSNIGSIGEVCLNWNFGCVFKGQPRL